MTFTNPLQWFQNRKSEKHRLSDKGPPLKHLLKKKPYPALSSTNPQSQSIFFGRLPLEIRLIIYKLLFGDRPIHYECDWLEVEKRWQIKSFECFARMERFDWDDCAGYTAHAVIVSKRWGLWMDVSIMFTCWRAYLESLEVLYHTNEFRFSNYDTVSKTFPRQVPAQGLTDIHRLTFWWSLQRDSQPHLSRKNRIQYDKFWVTLQKTFINLTEIRIFVDTIGLADMKSIPEDMAGDTDEEKHRYIQSAWLDGMESMIEAKQKLEVFEIHIDNGLYRHVKERIQPWLKQKEEERKTERKIDRICYKAYRCKHTTITSQGVPASRPISRGSSKIGIEDSRSVPAEFWRKKIRQLGK